MPRSQFSSYSCAVDSMRLLRSHSFGSYDTCILSDSTKNGTFVAIFAGDLMNRIWNKTRSDKVNHLTKSNAWVSSWLSLSQNIVNQCKHDRFGSCLISICRYTSPEVCIEIGSLSFKQPYGNDALHRASFQMQPTAIQIGVLLPKMHFGSVPIVAVYFTHCSPWFSSFNGWKIGAHCNALFAANLCNFHTKRKQRSIWFYSFCKSHSLFIICFRATKKTENHAECCTISKPAKTHTIV